MKKKILMISDDIRLTSGVGTQAKYIVDALIESGKYSVVHLAGAIHHDNPTPVQVNPDLLIFPVKGFGTKEIVRDFLSVHKPDAVWIMTDPRFWGWLWEMDTEIRAKVPLVYYHVWDNYPVPHFNKKYYESNDYIATISKLTQEIVEKVSPEVKSEYLPHAVDPSIFKPIEESKINIVPKDRTMFFWNNRNAHRKMAATLMRSFKRFLETSDGKATLVMHTDPFDHNGPNLVTVAEMLGFKKEELSISASKLSQEDLAHFYNAADCVVNISYAEGFGLGTLEALSCGTPIIVNMTGGLQEQVTDGTNYFGVGIKPTNISVVGSQSVHYINEDRVSEEDLIAAFNHIHNMSRAERKKLGMAGRDHVMKNYNFTEFKSKWIKLFDKVMEECGSWETRNYKAWTLKEVK